MDDTERGVGADFDLLVAIPPDEAGSEPGAFGEAERLAPRAARRWSAGEKARIVRESFWRGERVSDVARRYGLSGKQLSSWRTLAREGKLTLPSSAEQDEPRLVDASTYRRQCDECADLRATSWMGVRRLYRANGR